MINLSKIFIKIKNNNYYFITNKIKKNGGKKKKKNKERQKNYCVFIYFEECSDKPLREVDVDLLFLQIVNKNQL